MYRRPFTVSTRSCPETPEPASETRHRIAPGHAFAPGSGETISILGKPVPHVLVPVRVGRDIVLMVETAALTHRLKATGYNPAKQLNEQLVALMTKS